MGPISGVISRVSITITHIRGLKNLLLATHEPPSGMLLSHVQTRLAERAWRVVLQG